MKNIVIFFIISIATIGTMAVINSNNTPVNSVNTKTDVVNKSTEIIKSVELELGNEYQSLCQTVKMDSALIERLNDENQSVIRSSVVYRLLTYNSFIKSVDYNELGYHLLNTTPKQMEVFMNALEKHWCLAYKKQYDTNRYISVKTF